MVDENNDIDVETQEDDFDQELSAKPSLREAWDSNPLLKIGAVVLLVVLAGGAYFTFFGKQQVKDTAMIRNSASTDVKAGVGTNVLDQTYTDAIKKNNQQRTDAAKATGTSVMPTPVDTSESSQLKVPEQAGGQADPLQAWRREAEARRLQQEQKVMEEESGAPTPEAVPMVVPIRPVQQAVKADPEAAKRLAQQMRVIIAAQTPGKSEVASITQVESAYRKQQDDAAKKKNGDDTATGTGAGGSGDATADGTDGAPQAAKSKVIVAAGSILYAQLMNELNSDITGPVLVQVLSGPFSGGRALGSLQLQDEYLVLNFSRIIKDGVVYAANGIALDEHTTLAAQQTSVDHHYFARVVLPAAAEFIKGYAAAAAQTSTSTTTTDGGGVATDNPAPDATEQVYAGVQEGADKVSQILDQNSSKPITVHVAKGTTMGILMLDSITTANADK